MWALKPRQGPWSADTRVLFADRLLVITTNERSSLNRRVGPCSFWADGIICRASTLPLVVATSYATQSVWMCVKVLR